MPLQESKVESDAYRPPRRILFHTARQCCAFPALPSTRLPAVKILLLFVAVATFVFSVGGSDADAQAGRATGQSTNWPTYGGNLASHRYSPADQITKDRSAC